MLRTFFLDERKQEWYLASVLIKTDVPPTERERIKPNVSGLVRTAGRQVIQPINLKNDIVFETTSWRWWDDLTVGTVLFPRTGAILRDVQNAYRSSGEDQNILTNICIYKYATTSCMRLYTNTQTWGLRFYPINEPHIKYM